MELSLSGTKKMRARQLSNACLACSQPHISTHTLFFLSPFSSSGAILSPTSPSAFRHSLHFTRSLFSDGRVASQMHARCALHQAVNCPLRVAPVYLGSDALRRSPMRARVAAAARSPRLRPQLPASRLLRSTAHTMALCSGRFLRGSPPPRALSYSLRAESAVAILLAARERRLRFQPTRACWMPR